MAEKPAILQDQTIVVHESWPYRLLRGTSIQLNRLMFAALILLALWLVWAALAGDSGCAASPAVAEQDGALLDVGEGQTCSVWLTPTSTYLASVSVLAFVGSILFGLLGLVVGKQVLAATPAADEVGARREDED